MKPNAGIPDLLVVGGGVVGLSVAWEISRRGYRVTVLERSSVASESSWAAAGMLSPLGEAMGAGPMLEFGKASLEMYPGWIAEIERRSGASIGHVRCGKVQVAMSPDDVEPLRSLGRVGNAAGVSCSWLDGRDLRDLEPSAAADARGALYMEDDGAVDNRALGAALGEACRRAGVDIREGTPVAALEADVTTVRGVVLEDRRTVAGRAVLIAAGAWSGEIAGLPRPMPVVPVRGQMLALRPESPPSRRILGHGHVYVVPREDGRVLVGATTEDVGFEKATTGAGLSALFDGAVRLVPSLASAPTVERWSGLRPRSRDGLPMIGADPDIADLYYATGHYRNGILLAPATGRAIADVLESGSSALLPTEFRPERFDHPTGKQTVLR